MPGRDSILKIQGGESAYCGIHFFFRYFFNFGNSWGIVVLFLCEGILAFVGEVSRFPASEAEIVVHASFSFFR